MYVWLFLLMYNQWSHIYVLTYAYGTTYTQHKHYMFNYTDFFLLYTYHYAKPSLCTTVFNYIYICMYMQWYLDSYAYISMRKYVHTYVYIYIYMIWYDWYDIVHVIWYYACHMRLCMSYDMYTFNSAHCFINWIVYNLVWTPMTGTFSFQAIAVAPRGKRAMELLNITVGALAQLIRAARDP